MAIVARTPAECYKQFSEHIGPLISKTIPTQQPLLCRRIVSDDRRRTLEFAGGTVPLETDYGPLHFHLAQLLGAEPKAKGWRLVTLNYWYRIQQNAGDEHALLRWEYEKSTPRDRHARNHVQIRSTVPLEAGLPLDLNRLHTPTGWTLIEEVIRFLIHDLGVKPPCGDAWHTVLSESEDMFYTRFASKGNREEE